MRAPGDGLIPPRRRADAGGRQQRGDTRPSSADTVRASPDSVFGGASDAV